ncbi:MAG: [FeFe] hydrogenase H-cluster radical SAM maturase HydE [Massiliimalia sp.]|jgi:biotin synthase
MQTTQLIEQISHTHKASAQELSQILTDVSAKEALFCAANRVCLEQKGNQVLIRALLEFSNICRRQCRYCGLNCFNSNCQRYRMEPDEILETVKEAYDAGYQTIVLQSGEDPYYTQEMVVSLVREIRRTCPGMAITLSIGERPKEEYAAFRQAGADRYLIKQETADPQIYAALHPDSSLKERVTCLKNLKELGYETGSGFMIGLPGQTAQTIAADLLLLQEIPCDMAGIGPFIPHPDTPLKDHPAGSVTVTQQAVALARLLLPKANLPATTALGVVSQSGKQNIFSCGANVIMKKVTPWSHRKQYEIYPANLGEIIDVKTSRQQLEQELRDLGKIPV